MKRLLTAITCTITPIAIASATCLALPVQAQTSQDCGVSFMVLPGGDCLELSYLGILGRGRSDMEQVEQIYQRQFNANVALEVLYNRYPGIVGETAEQRDDRYESLAETRVFRDDMAERTQSVEDILYPLQVQSMSIVGIAFSEDR